MLFVLLASFIAFAVRAQSDLVIHGNDKGLYINHSVQAKENFYAIGRFYGVSPKDIAAFNSLDMNQGLSVGQNLMIPLTGSNFSQTTGTGKPVYYVVGEKEGLYRVSLKNNKVLMANLRKWNNLTSDNISTGQKLIVGFLTSDAQSNVAAADKKPETKNEPVKETPVEKQAPVKKESTDEAKPARPLINTAAVAYNDAQGGHFKSQFDQQSKAMNANKELTVTASIFKTASGWQDGKYYALMDGVEPGTIIKVINPTNKKAVYAKVLGQMAGIRQNTGLDLRVSNAAASALDINDTDKFVVRVNY